MRKIIIPLLFVCSMSFGQMFSAQNAESCIGCDPTVTEVIIGTQTWMRKNLAVTNYNDATGIPKVTDNAAWGELSTPAYCWYDNDSITYSSTYGALYNWYAVNTGKLCPTGWHVPSDAELTTLTDYLEGESVAGGKLKEVGTDHWLTPNTGATDSVCFTALPGGLRAYNNGTFGNNGNYGGLWSSTEYDATNAWGRYMHYITTIVNHNNFNKNYGFSVRCIKD